MDFHYDAPPSPASSSSASSAELYTPSPRASHKRDAGRKKFNETRHPVYRGVRHRPGSKWVCEVREPHKKSRIWLGTYPTPEMAARVYDVTTLALKGKSAPLNFPDSAWLLPRPKSCSPRDIKATAVEAAQAFAPMASSSCSTNYSADNDYAQSQQVKNLEKASEASRTFWDEEAMFNMPGLLDSMAEGMLLTPPSMQQSFNWDNVDYSNMDMSLCSD